MLIPGTLSYVDPVSDKEEIWLDNGVVGKEKNWIRCLVQGQVEQINDVNVAPVRVQKLVQQIQGRFAGMLAALFSKEKTLDDTYIPTVDGELSNETAKIIENNSEGTHLAWSNDQVITLPDFDLISSYGNVSLMRKIESLQKTVETPIPKILPNFTVQTPSNSNSLSENTDLNSLHPRERIAVIEQGLEKFEQLLLTKISEIGITRPGLPLAIQNPFVFVRQNKTNRIKYYGDAVAEAQKHGMHNAAVLFAMPEPYRFCYAFKEDLDRNDGVMAYAPLLRSVIMNAYQSPDNAFYNTVFMHEMVHCMHAAHQRKRDMQAHLTFNIPKNGSSEKKVVIQEEFDAYAVELEAINLVLDGAIHRAAQHGKMLNPDEVMERFKMEEERKMTIMMLCRLGTLYFHRSTIGNYAPEYIDFVANMTRFDGYDLYTPDYKLICKSND